MPPHTCLGLHSLPQVSRSVTEGLSITVGDVGLACLLGAASHIVFLAFNVLGAQLLQLGGPDRYEAARLKQALVLQVRGSRVAA